MKIYKAGVTKPKGFKANGLSCGIKRSGRPDLSLIMSEVPCLAAGVYTRNSVKAAPLVVSARHLKKGQARVIICNSGNANCFTGDDGLVAAEATAQAVAQVLGIKTAEVVVASTGIIGKPLPVDKIVRKIPEIIAGARAGRESGRRAAQGIMTTDTILKELAVQAQIGGAVVTVGGCAKGSGMIEPNMATMLAFVTTDAAITGPMLRLALRTVTERTFNSITVDGCMSTNDMVVVLANGQAGNAVIRDTGADFDRFCCALEIVCLDLAKKIVLDGEGASKFIQIDVLGAPTEKTARQVAKAIANSNLVKTAAYGPNPNWGRIAAAAGSLGLRISEKNLKIRVKTMKSHIHITADLQLGDAAATVFTCDLTEEYIRINGKYT